MIPRYISEPAGPYERGQEFGEAQREAVRATVSAYEHLFADMHGLAPDDVDRLGAEVATALAARYPELLTEIRGIAAGARIPDARLLAVNARTEIFAGSGPPQCSVIGVTAPRSERPLLAQNWDWHPDAAEGRVLWTVCKADGSWFTTLTEAGILAKIGLNSFGLGLCINILATTGDGGVAGLPIHLLLRLVLDRCGSQTEASDLIERNHFSASTAISIATADGLLRTHEVSPSEVTTIADAEGLLLHTNHFLVQPSGLEDTYRREWPDTLKRLDELRDLAAADRIGPKEIKAALSSHDADRIAVCCHDAENPNYSDRQQTLVSLLIDVRRNHLELAEGPPCSTPYESVDLPAPSTRRAPSHLPDR